MPVDVEPKLETVFHYFDRSRPCHVCRLAQFKFVCLIRDDGVKCWVCPTCYRMPLSKFVPPDHPDSPGYDG
jgi:hypothetical protein